MAFYSRIIQIDGVNYKQISSDSWTNIATGEIIDNTRMIVIINEYKIKKTITPVTPSGGPSGSCCTIPNMANGVFACEQKNQEACGGGCFTISGTCDQTDENPVSPCETNCVRCCFQGNNYCMARKASECIAIGATYFNVNGCTACKYGVCSTDQNNNTTNATERFFGRGCTGVFIVGGGVSDF